jgi:hypothetical protein
VDGCGVCPVLICRDHRCVRIVGAGRRVKGGWAGRWPVRGGG